MTYHVLVEDLSAQTSSLDVLDLFSVYGWIQHISQIGEPGRQCTVSFIFEHDRDLACSQPTMAFKKSHIRISPCHERNPGAEYSGSWDANYIESARPSRTPSIALVSGTLPITSPQQVYDHFMKAGRVIGVGFRRAGLGDVQVFVTFENERSLWEALRILNPSILRLATLNLRKYSPQTTVSVPHHQAELFRRPPFEKLPIKKHQSHRRDHMYRQFCAVFGPTLKAVLPVNQEEADAILTRMFENLPYGMRPRPVPEDRSRG